MKKLPAIKIRSSYFYIFLFVIFSKHTYSEEKIHIKIPYTAELKSYNKLYPNKSHKNLVSMSPHGVRIEANNMLSYARKGVYIQNFENNSSWILDPKKKIFSSMNTIENEEDTSNDTVGGIMATRPCMDSEDNEKLITGQKIINDEKIIFWKCKDKNENYLKQGYSQKWNLVVREELSNGDISELINIKKVEFDNDFFMPPKNYREVSLREFYTGAPSLEQYTPEK